MSFATGTSRKATSSSYAEDSRIGAEGGSNVVRGNENLIIEGGEASSITAVEKTAGIAGQAIDTGETVALEGFDLSRDMAELIADVAARQADLSLEARQLDAGLLDTVFTAQKNLADASVENSASLAETKLTGGLNLLASNLTLAIVVGGILYALKRK